MLFEGLVKHRCCHGGSNAHDFGNVVIEPCRGFEGGVVDEKQGNLVRLPVSQHAVLTVLGKVQHGVIHGAVKNRVKRLFQATGKRVKSLAIKANNNRHSACEVRAGYIFIFLHPGIQIHRKYILYNFQNVKWVTEVRCLGFGKRLGVVGFIPETQPDINVINL